MKKIISILILSLITFVFTQPALADNIANCKECCKGIANTTNQGHCTTACSQTTTNKVKAMQDCQASCDKNITTSDVDKSLCQSCCASLGYTYGSPITNYQQISTLISTITRWFQGIVMAIAVIMIIYGGFLYITASGSEDKTKTAQKLLTYAMIGIAIVLLAWGAEFLILSFLTP